MTLTRYNKEVFSTPIQYKSILLHKCKEPNHYSLEVTKRELEGSNISHETSIFYTVLISEETDTIFLVKTNMCACFDKLVDDLLFLSNQRKSIFRAKKDLDQTIKKGSE